MNFGEALNKAKEGKCIARTGWNGKNQFVFLATGVDFNAPSFDASECDVMDSMAIKTTNNVIQVGWLASQSDMLSNDWEVVSEELGEII